MTNEPYWKTQKAANNILKTFFAGVSADEMSVTAIYNATGRDLRAKVKNSAWLSNKLATLRRYKYITTVYSSIGRRKVAGIKLTDEGRKALGRQPSGTPEPIQITLDAGGLAPEENDNIVTPETVLRDVKVLQQQLPSFKVIFKIEPREELIDH